MVIRVYRLQTSPHTSLVVLLGGKNPTERTGLGTSDAELCVPQTQLTKEAST